MNNEHRLIRSARKLNMLALAEIYDTFSPGIFRYAARMLSDRSLAEDCVNETFSRFLNALHNGGGPNKHLRAYLYRIAHNWITDRHRDGVADVPQSTIEQQVDPADGPERATEKAIDMSRVREAMFQLSPDQQHVLDLKFTAGLSNRDVALALNKTQGAVKSLQNRGLRALKRILLGTEGES